MNAFLILEDGHVFEGKSRNDLSTDWKLWSMSRGHRI